VAVHSLKDLPTVPAAGLLLAAVPPRGPTGDALVSHRHRAFDALPAGAVVATSSLRRRAQLLHRRPDLRILDIRGNVETRLRKLDEQSLDALILAQAGLERIAQSQEMTELLDPSWMLPAVGQGALGLECRAEDRVTRDLLIHLDDPASRQAVLAERAFLRTLGGGCQVPIGAAAHVNGETLALRGAVLHPEGKRRIEDQTRGPRAAAESLGQQLAHTLLRQGAEELLGLRRA
jgi:hydroxymethylbilane synthase